MAPEDQENLFLPYTQVRAGAPRVRIMSVMWAIYIGKPSEDQDDRVGYVGSISGPLRKDGTLIVM